MADDHFAGLLRCDAIFRGVAEVCPLLDAASDLRRARRCRRGLLLGDDLEPFGTGHDDDDLPATGLERGSNRVMNERLSGDRVEHFGERALHPGPLSRRKNHSRRLLEHWRAFRLIMDPNGAGYATRSQCFTQTQRRTGF